MVSKKAIAIGAGIGIVSAIGYLMYNVYAQQQQTPPKPSTTPSSTGGGPSGCPSGTQWSDTCQACVPPPQSCPCDSVWDECLGQCSKLIPAAIDMQSEYDFKLAFIHEEDCMSGYQCKGIYQGGTCEDIFQGKNCGCYAYNRYFGYLPPCTDLGHFTNVFSITGRVLDASGRPICNVPVEFEYPSSEVVTFITDKGDSIPITVSISGDTSDTTAEDGSFTLNMAVDYNYDAGDCWECALNCGCFNYYAGYLTFPVKVKIPGTTITATPTVKVYLWNCFAYNLGSIIV